MMEQTEKLRYWLALLFAPRIGPVQFHELLEQFGDISVLFTSPPGGKLHSYLRDPDWDSVDACLAWAEQEGSRIISLDDSRYPDLLKQIHDAPPLLFVRGDTELLQNPQLAMVGSRNPSMVGRETAQEFACSLASAGMTITSGLALGIDAASHQGALDGGGHTVAVFGTGLDRVYPAKNRDLAHAIVERGGVLISEYPPGTEPKPANFPRRNRIISGLSLGTLVVEAALRSGSLITARCAAEQGREVFAIPGSIHNPLARGCHQLIRQGAKLVEDARDILEELAPQLHAVLQEAEELRPSPVPDGDHKTLLDCMGNGPNSVDQLVKRSGLTADAVSSMLLLLELQGHVVSTAGGYALVSKRR